MNIDDAERDGYPMDRIQTMNERDAEEQYIQEALSYGDGMMLSQMRTRTRSHVDQIIINWEVDDPENPFNWPTVLLHRTVQSTHEKTVN